jgi:hypothetical protein
MARIQTVEPLASAQTNLATGRESNRIPQSEAKRVSFVVRITVDKNGQPGRTEVEGVENNKKQNFLNLDGEQLVTFMKACIFPESNLKTRSSIAPFQEKEVSSIQAPHTLNFSLSITDVRAFRPANSDYSPLIYNSEEAFIVQTRFQLKGIDALLITSQESPYVVKVFFNEVTSSKSWLWTTHRTHLTRDLLEYSVLVDVSGLPTGLYRLFTVVTLGESFKMAQFYSNIIIQVI